MSTFSAKPNYLVTSLHNHHNSISSFPTCLPSLSKLQKTSPVVAFNGATLQHKQRRTNPQTTLPIVPSSTFLQMGSQDTSSETPFLVKSTASESASTSSASRTVVGILDLVVSVGIFLAMDKFLKKAFVAAAIKFPSALFGMFCKFSVLVFLNSTVPAVATSLMNFFEPALLFIQRWLPLFYVPSLVVLPLSVKSIPTASGIKICFIIARQEACSRDFHICHPVYHIFIVFNRSCWTSCWVGT
ncbi:plastidal glycolate/glycerate translocator 1, chloroplastic-like [Malus sylvestris]|uniref:plastidal glycolate/glycerate translocator 1, chloroplastic-like n=1 Tax=Malus sylvestris TaxID=3752 RepID=UPI0021ACE865|nr:plastidal glycolate/glycerate translocator 1, chloroplastic-like [Malus sylvestris]